MKSQLPQHDKQQSSQSRQPKPAYRGINKHFIRTIRKQERYPPKPSRGCVGQVQDLAGRGPRSPSGFIGSRDCSGALRGSRRQPHPVDNSFALTVPPRRVDCRWFPRCVVISYFEVIKCPMCG